MKQFCVNSILFLLFFFGGLILHAQENSGVVLSKNQLKLQKLENDVKRSEVKVNSIKAKLEVSDSLIRVGKDMENEAISNGDHLQIFQHFLISSYSPMVHFP